MIPPDTALVERRARLLGPAYRLFYDEPVHLVRGEGVWLFDPRGNRYLDAYNNVASVGHAQPDVVEAVSRQWAALNTHTRYLHETVLDYAEALLGTLPPSLGHVMFTCTGSEANDLAYRIAKASTGGTGMIVTALAYHGVTDAVAQFSPSLGAAVIGPHVRTVPAPDASRHPVGELGSVFARDVRTAVDDLERCGIRLAGMICDTIFSSDGIFADPPGFMAEAVAVVRSAGGVFIADEVQAGFGRTGDALWGFLRHGLAPDLVTLGKPMGNGQPIGGVAVRPDLVAAFGRQVRYFNTFGGNPVSAAAGSAVLRVIRRDALIANAHSTGLYLKQGLQRLAERHPAIGAVRGAGLYLGVALIEDPVSRRPATALAARVVNGLRRRHVLISAAGPDANVLKLRPPLVFGRDHADLLLATLDDTLSQG